MNPFVGLNYALGFQLTKVQERISNKLVTYSNINKNILIHAVCGSGKTEISYKLINYFLNQGKTICFATPRRDLTNDLFSRIRKAFNDKISIVKVHGESKTILNGDIVICTTHQLYRYHNQFDLLIIDEVDAFPFKNNATLENIAKTSCKGLIVRLTATANKSDYKNNIVLKLFERFHKRKIPIPIFRKDRNEVFVNTIKDYLSRNKKVLVYLPRKIDTVVYWNKLQKHFSNSYYINSLSLNRSKIIRDFRSGIYNILFTTTILERGFTFGNTQIIVKNADNPIFDTPTLLQICGRVDRKIDDTEAEAVIIAHRKTKAIKKCISSTKRFNDLSNL